MRLGDGEWQRHSLMEGCGRRKLDGKSFVGFAEGASLKRSAPLGGGSSQGLRSESESGPVRNSRVTSFGQTSN